MAKIYSGVQGIRKPAMGNWETYSKRAEEYVKKVVDYAKKNSKSPAAGKEISFGVCDGSARYVVFSLNPVQLIHLDIGDGYQFQYANRLTAADVKKEIERSEALDRIFSKGGAK